MPSSRAEPHRTLHLAGEGRTNASASFPEMNAAAETGNEAAGARKAGQGPQNEAGAQLLLRLVGQAVLEGGRSMDPTRLASMTKRLACTALQSGVGEVMGLLASLDRLLRSADQILCYGLGLMRFCWQLLDIAGFHVCKQPHTTSKASFHP